MHKSGFVNIIGNPNTGKSTLMNLLVGEQISITTPKSQTTRHRITGIVNKPEMQIVYSDTPGVIRPCYQLQSSMLGASESALNDADILIYVTDTVEKPGKNSAFIEKVNLSATPLLLIINKIDLSNQQDLETLSSTWQSIFPRATIFPISATCRFNTDNLQKHIETLLPQSPPYFGKDTLTDRPARFFVTEIIREKILLYYQKEVPYSVEVVIEQFQETGKLIVINALIVVERESQKGIIIGNRGMAIKKAGTMARRDIERFFKKRVYLSMTVKVEKDWRNRSRILRQFGYNTP